MPQYSCPHERLGAALVQVELLIQDLPQLLSAGQQEVVTCSLVGGEWAWQGRSGHGKVEWVWQGRSGCGKVDWVWQGRSGCGKVDWVWQGRSGCGKVDWVWQGWGQREKEDR